MKQTKIILKYLSEVCSLLEWLKNVGPNRVWKRVGINGKHVYSLTCT